MILEVEEISRYQCWYDSLHLLARGYRLHQNGGEGTQQWCRHLAEQGLDVNYICDLLSQCTCLQHC